MSIQSKRVDLSTSWDIADAIKKDREQYEDRMRVLKKSLALDVRSRVYKGRTDVVLVSELLPILRKAFKRAGFSANRKELEKYI